MKKNIFKLLTLLTFIISANSLFATTQNAEIISKNVLYKDEFENTVKIGYEVEIKNISKTTWATEGSNPVLLKATKDKSWQFPMFLIKDVKPNESVKFKIIFTTNKKSTVYNDSIYLSDIKNKEISGSRININININEIKNKLPSSSVLNIEPIEQKYSLNCESASLKMALGYFGIEKTEEELLEETGFSTKLPPTKIGNRIVWGDPEKGYVGNYNGLYSEFCSNQTGDTSIRTLKCATGWGVNNNPIAKNAQKYLKNSYDLDNASITDLKMELSNNNPIIFWQVNDNNKPEEMIHIYTYDDWKKIKYTRTHVVLLVGYENMADDTIYIFNDVAYGKKVYLAEDDMRRIWERYNNNIAVIKK